MAMAVPIWRKLEIHRAQRARSRAWFSAGSSMAARIPMMAMTTSSSIRVKALVLMLRTFISPLSFRRKTSCILMSLVPFLSAGFMVWMKPSLLRHFHKRSVIDEENPAGHRLGLAFLDDHTLRLRAGGRRGARHFKFGPLRCRQRRIPRRAPEAADLIVTRVVPFNGQLADDRTPERVGGSILDIHAELIGLAWRHGHCLRQPLIEIGNSV